MDEAIDVNIKGKIISEKICHAGAKTKNDNRFILISNVEVSGEGTESTELIGSAQSNKLPSIGIANTKNLSCNITRKL